LLLCQRAAAELHHIYYATSSKAIAAGIDMPHWITFDQETSSALRSKLPQEIIFQRPSHGVMEYVLEEGRDTSVAVLPASAPDKAIVAVFRWNLVPAQPEAPVVPAGVRAGGFLGLLDEPALEEEQEKQGWWKRLWN
jgi:hypothetical protein